MEPVLPLSLFKVRNISASSGVSFLRGLMLLAVVSYIPLFVQAGLGHSINTSSEILDTFLLPMIVASVIGGTLVTRLSYRTLTVTGMVIATVGAYTLTFVGAGVGTAQLAESCAIMGFGVGMTFSSTFLSIQNSAPRKQIGIASSLPQFMGNLGGTIGLAILGTIQVNTFASKVSGVLAVVPPQYQQLALQYLGEREPGGPDSRVATGPAAAAGPVPCARPLDPPAEGRLRRLDHTALHSRRGDRGGCGLRGPPPAGVDEAAAPVPSGGRLGGEEGTRRDPCGGPDVALTRAPLPPESSGPCEREKSQPEAHPRMQYKWVALSNTTIGTLMASLDTNIVLIALPTEGRKGECIHVVLDLRR